MHSANEQLLPVSEAKPKINLLGFDLALMQALFSDWGESSFRADQMLKWIHQQGQSDFSTLTTFSKKLRERLQQEACIEWPEIAHDSLSNDGTRKWLLRLADGNCIEMVYIPEKNRGTLCISSQVGCALNCSFCATAQQGFNRNLSSAEIVAQVWIAKNSLNKTPNQSISNIVFMGMGEPLLNTQQVAIAARLFLNDKCYGLSKRRVTVSTAGVVPMIEKLYAQVDVSLAISLHAPTDELRNELVPINKKYPIAQLLAACWTYIKEAPQKRHILFEYVLIDQVNDSVKQAHLLAQLIKDMPCKVNLIPFNPYPNTPYKCASIDAQMRFQGILRSHGVRTLLRRTRGSDIDAACGQLAGQFKDRTRRTVSWQMAQ